MKVNLLLYGSGARGGYENLEARLPDREAPDKWMLGGAVEANEADELVAAGVLDHFDTNEADQALSYWVSRLAHGGVLAITVTDLREACRLYLEGRLDNNQMNSLLHGTQDGPGRTKGCSLTMEQLCAVLEGKGMRILTKRVEGTDAVIRAVRP